MATKAEQWKSEEQREHGKNRKTGPTSKRQPKKATWGHDKAHASAKATHVLEEAAPGTRPSRESTRKGANRLKSDSAFNLTEQTKKGAPTSQARKSRARASRVRGA